MPRLKFPMVLIALLIISLHAAPATSLPGIQGLAEAVAGLIMVRVEATAAVDALKRGDGELASKHADHAWEAFEEYVRDLAYNVDPNTANNLEASLREFRDAVARGSIDEALSKVKVVEETINLIYSSLPGGLPQDFIFNMIVIAKLVEEAMEAYEEDLITDAQLIMEAALNVYRALPAEEVLGEEAAEIEELFSSALKALAEGGDFEGPAEAIVVEVSEVAGLGAAEDDAIEALQKVRELVEAALEAYRAGDYARAEDLAATAYLEGYELAEGAVESLDPELNEEIEITLREEFRRAIAERAPLEKVEALAEEVYRLLGEAERLLTETRAAEIITVTETIEAVTTVTEASPQALAIAAGLAVVALAELVVLLRLRSRGTEVTGSDVA